MSTAIDDGQLHEVIQAARARQREVTEMVGLFLGACVADDLLAVEGASAGDRQRAIENRGHAANGLMRLLLEDLQTSTVRFFNEVAVASATAGTVPE